MVRLFTAIAVPKQVDHYLDNVLLNSGPIVIQPAKHITLQFIGLASRPTALRIESQLRRLKYDEFDVSIEGCELFKANSLRPILVAKVKLNPALIELYQQVGDIVAEQGIPPNTRPYKPHITLVRFSSPSSGDVDKIMRRAQSIEAAFKVNNLVLYGVDRSLPIPYFKQQEYHFTTTAS